MAVAAVDLAVSATPPVNNAVASKTFATIVVISNTAAVAPAAVAPAISASAVVTAVDVTAPVAIAVVAVAAIVVNVSVAVS